MNEWMNNEFIPKKYTLQKNKINILKQTCTILSTAITYQILGNESA
jgi:hypothetical protein